MWDWKINAAASSAKLNGLMLIVPSECGPAQLILWNTMYMRVYDTREKLEFIAFGKRDTQTSFGQVKTIKGASWVYAGGVRGESELFLQVLSSNRSRAPTRHPAFNFRAIGASVWARGSRVAFATASFVPLPPQASSLKGRV